MQVQARYGETLPALLRRRRGVPERVTLGVAAAVIVLLGLAVLVLRDPLGGRTQVVNHRGMVFNLLYNPSLAHPVAPHPGELQRLAGRHGALRVTLTVRPLRLPAYRGTLGGALPIQAVAQEAQLRRQLGPVQVTGEGVSNVAQYPGYEVDFRFGSAAAPGLGRDVLVFPEDKPGIRDGLLLSLRQFRGPRPPGAAGKAVIVSLKQAIRSLRFGTGR